MHQVIGDILPLALTVAISPIPIVAVILSLLAPQAGGTSLGFLLGWLAGIVVVGAVVVAIASAIGLSTHGSGSTAGAIVKLVLGAGVVLLAVRQWRSRPRHGVEPKAPKWMAAIDTMTLPKAAGLAFLLSGVNPKNLAMILAAGVSIGSAGLPLGQVVVVLAIFTAIAGCTVALPVIAYAVAREKARGILDELRTWLVAHNAAVMAAVLGLIGVALIGKGIAGI
ncbi:membrane protein [Actinocatenispora thailandica]|uniref:Membrane protein n=1 Tax=Actinocatenispora thailandica TaxID=227318 RepID=A0A7R7DSF7_9ACTN|nr:GAP family protein [Actinocatenispora thailandica]BCJ36957.1 membrane protein [Actinocatenispora thailandica]